MTQTFRPVLIGLLPALAAALLLALLLAGRNAPAIQVIPGLDLPGIGITPTTAPARTADPAPLIEVLPAAPALEPAAPALDPLTPANPTTMPGTGLGSGPTTTTAPSTTISPPSRPVGDQDPLPYPNLPNPNLPSGKGPQGQ